MSRSGQRVEASWDARACAVLLMVGLGCTGDEEPTISMSVVQVELGAEIDGVAAREGRYLARLEVQVDNGGDDPLPLAFAFFRVRSRSGVEVTAAVATEFLDEPCAADLFVSGHADHQCSLAVEMPNGELPDALRYEDEKGHEASTDIELCPGSASSLCGLTCFDPEELECSNQGVLECNDAERTACEGVCVDLASDPKHCGACGMPVPDDMACVDGMVGCPSPTALCGDACCPDACGDEPDCTNTCDNGQCAYRVQDIAGACDEFCAARDSECLDAIAHFAGSCTSDNAVICSFVYDDTMCDPPEIECICAAPG